MQYKYANEVLKWRDYEKTKNKNFIDFSKNPAMLEKFNSLIANIRIKSYEN